MAERPVLLLVHGFPLDGRMWRHQAEALSDQFQVLTPDLDGHGVNATNTPKANMEGIARSLAARLDEAGIDKAHLGGFSMGGYAVFAFLHHFPGRVLSLSLVDTRATADDEAGRRGRDDMAARINADGAKVAAEAMLPKMFTGAVDERVRLEAEHWMLDQPPEALVADLQAMRDRPDSSTILAAIAVPTLVIVGEEDPVTPPAASEAMVAAIPGAKLVRIAGAAHLAPVERPEEVTGALRAFLSGLSG
jgi:pimeloyl-ACP methyl ester carboxylesterase